MNRHHLGGIRISFNQAVIGLESNASRTILTTLGLIIGIALVVLVISAGNGAESWIKAQLTSFGSNTVFTEPKIPSARSDTESQFTVGSGVTITTLKASDVAAVERIPGVVAAYGASFAQAKLSFLNKVKNVTLLGTNAAFLKVDTAQVAMGRFFSAEEDAGLAQVLVLGAGLKATLFGDQDALGQYVKVKGQNYRVIGVMKEQGARFFLNFDDQAYIPLSTMHKKILGIDYLVYFVTKFEDNTNLPALVQQMEMILRKNHAIRVDDGSKDDFSINASNDNADLVSGVLGGLTLLLSVIAAISLLVGGIGIMNVMFVTVTERTKEIGLRKAIGAKPIQILLQFFFEAIIISLFGGAIGIAIGVMLAAGLAALAQSFNFEWPLIITFNTILLAVGFSSICGIVFGLAPALKAARMDPIKALRFE